MNQRIEIVSQKGVWILRTASIMFSLDIQMYEGGRYTEEEGMGLFLRSLSAVTPLIKTHASGPNMVGWGVLRTDPLFALG